MKTAVITFYLIVSTIFVCAAEDDGLFVLEKKGATSYKVENGNIVIRQRAERLTLTEAVLRYDTKDRKILWLELDFTKRADPGDFHIFTVGGKQYDGFKLRETGANDNGGRWALKFNSLKEGRSFLKMISKAYELSAANTRDDT